MKKTIHLLTVAALCLTLSACGSVQQSGNPSHEKPPVVSAQSTAVNQSVLKKLMLENDYCNRFIFGADSLSTKGAAIKETIYEVNSEKFNSYAAFKDYLLTVYTSDYVDFLLTDYPSEGQPKYVNIDGKLCLNTNLAGGRGYFVDWSQLQLEIITFNENNCRFTATGTTEEPGDPPLKTPYSIEGKAVFQNNRWVLTEMLY